MRRHVPDAKTLQRLIATLAFDSRANGYHGLALVDDMPDLDLAKGSRLILSDELSDVHAIYSATAPITLTFFDTKCDLGLDCVCMLFAVIGFTMESIHLDVMHVLDLGVLQFLVGAVFMQLLQNNFAASTKLSAEMRRLQCLVELRKKLRIFYRTHPAPRRRQSRIGRLTIKMLGSLTEPRLAAKAA